jgi:MFS family permease
MVLEGLKASPRAFKVLVTSALIENMAFGLVIPFLALYMYNEIHISVPLIGLVMMAYVIAGLPSMIIGGMLADRIGRKKVLLASLGLMSITMLLYFFVSNFITTFLVAATDSFVGSLYMPAANAMIADVIPSRDRPKAFSTLRISWNIGIIFGPTLGTIIVATSPLRNLFVFGSVVLAGAFAMNLAFIPETKPDVISDEITLRKVLNVRKDRAFLLLCSLSGVFWFFFSQWISVLPLYASSELSVDAYLFGILFAVSGMITVVFQLPVTSLMVQYRRSLVLLLGQMIASLGFALIFLATEFYTLLLCIVVISVGEIVYMSIVSAIIADMAPEARRGTYMGFSGFVQTLGSGVGFLVGMTLLDALPDPHYVWFFFGGIGALTSAGYLVFAKMIGPEKDHPSKKDAAAGLVQHAEMK